MIEILFRLLIAHALCDFSLQSDAMVKGKNRNRLPDYVPQGQKYVACWPYWLSAHALICGGGVWWATGVMWLGLIEVVLHWLIDFAKCENWTNPTDDQAAHLGCRIYYLVILKMFL